MSFRLAESLLTVGVAGIDKGAAGGLRAAAECGRGKSETVEGICPCSGGRAEPCNHCAGSQRRKHGRNGPGHFGGETAECPGAFVSHGGQDLKTLGAGVEVAGKIPRNVGACHRIRPLDERAERESWNSRSGILTHGLHHTCGTFSKA